jgi:ABC-type phosphate transport system permease subunit
MAFTVLFALYGLTMFVAVLGWRRTAEAGFLLSLALSIVVFLRHATDTLAISL